MDEVCEVLDVGPEQIERPPRFGADQDPGFILGMGKMEDHVLILLDVGNVLSRNEVEIVSGIRAESDETVPT